MHIQASEEEPKGGEPGTEPGVQKDSGEEAPIEEASHPNGGEHAPVAHDQREEDEQQEPHDQREQEEQQEPHDQREKEQQEAKTQDLTKHVEVPGGSGEAGERTEQPEGGDVTEQAGEEEQPVKEEQLVKEEQPVNEGEKLEKREVCCMYMRALSSITIISQIAIPSQQIEAPPVVGMKEGERSPDELHPSMSEEAADVHPQPEEVQGRGH